MLGWLANISLKTVNRIFYVSFGNPKLDSDIGQIPVLIFGTINSAIVVVTSFHHKQ